MTVLVNSIRISAPPDKVWAVLASLELLERYDPGVAKSAIVSSVREGVGASRRCDLVAGGWFKERVVDWAPSKSLAFELVECTLPLRALEHRYLVTADGSETVVRQQMQYRLKYGLIGRLMNVLFVRRKWDAGIKLFLQGLKRHVETTPGVA